MSDPSRLLPQLNNTGLQQKDNQLYQFLKNLISSLSGLTTATATIISGSSSPNTIEINNTFINPSEESSDSGGVILINQSIVPGPTGATGAVGPPGATLFIEQINDFDIYPIPGPPGPAGAAGTGVTTDNTAFGSEPGSPAVGEVDYYNNSFFVGRWNGSVWAPWGPIFPLTLPTGAFSFINQGTASVDTTKGGIYLLIPAVAGTSWRIYKKSLGANSRVEVGFLVNLTNTASQLGLTLHESATGKFSTFTTQLNPYSFAIQHWTNPTTFSGNDLTGQAWISTGIVWLAAQLSGSNILYQISVDGQNWIQVLSIAKTSQFTTGPDGWGIVGNSATASLQTSLTLISMKES